MKCAADKLHNTLVHQQQKLVAARQDTFTANHL